MIEETFDVDSGQHLFVEVSDADIVIETGKGTKADIAVYLAARNMGRARSYFEELRFDVSQTGRSVRVTTDRDRRNRWNWERNGGASIVVVASIPESFDLEVATSDGDVTVGTIEGNVSIRTSDGDISVNRTVGKDLVLRTSDGDISTTSVSANEALIRTSDGDVTIDQIDAESVEATTSDGNISILEATGELSVRTSDGNISVASVDGDVFTARTSDGELSVGRLLAETANLHTSDGDINVDHLQGDLEATTSSGDVRVDIYEANRVDLRTSDGDVVIRTSEAMAADVAFSAQSIRISSALDFSGEIGKRSAEGRLNGGGPLLRARASSGVVQLSVR